MKNLKKKILLSILFIIFLFLIQKQCQVNAETTPKYRWPIGGENANETYIDYQYYGKAGQEPIKDGKSGRRYIVNNNLWPNEQPYYAECEDHFGLDITGINGHEYKIVSVVNGTVVATSAGNAYNQSTNHPDRNKRNSSYDGGGYGNYIVIQEKETGKCFLYAHLKGGTLKVSKGNEVKIGQEIAIMGSSGDSGHMHLHFEIRNSIQDTLNTKVWGPGYHSFVVPNSKTNIDPESEQGIGSNPNIKTQENNSQTKETVDKQENDEKSQEVKNTPAKIEKITYNLLLRYRRINIYFDKPVTVENAPVLKATVGNDTRIADFIKVENENKLVYRISYDEFDKFSEGDMYIDCEGTIIDKKSGISNVDCNFTKVKIGSLKSIKIANTFKYIVLNNRGDGNNDGLIDATDASIALKMYSQIISGKQLTQEQQKIAECLDVNNDQKVDSSDCTLILTYYTKISTGLTKEKAVKAIKCDINDDGKVDVIDYDILNEAIKNKQSNEKCDLDGNGHITLGDLEYFLSVLLDLGDRR